MRWDLLNLITISSQHTQQWISLPGYEEIIRTQTFCPDLTANNYFLLYLTKQFYKVLKSRVNLYCCKILSDVKEEHKRMLFLWPAMFNNDSMLRSSDSKKSYFDKRFIFGSICDVTFPLVSKSVSRITNARSSYFYQDSSDITCFIKDPMHKNFQNFFSLPSPLIWFKISLWFSWWSPFRRRMWDF